MNRINKVPVAAAAAAAGLVLLVTACSSEGGAEGDGGGEGGDADTPEVTIAMITHEVPGDTFWDLVRSGAEDAAALNNVDLQYSSDPEAGEQATLVQNAVDQDVDGIALTLAKPDALQGAVDTANDAGIPVVGLNSGIEDWVELGVQEYFGTDEHLAGTAFGERLNEVGAEKSVCVIQEQGHVALEARCDSLAEAFDGDNETIYVDGSDMADVQSTLTSTLEADPDVDYVVTLGAPFALTALDAVSDAGSDATVATFDTNQELVEKISDGEVAWAVDQQPYLQGYLAVQGLWLHATNGNLIGGGTEPVLTGPAFIDADNIDEIEAFAEKGNR